MELVSRAPKPAGTQAVPFFPISESNQLMKATPIALLSGERSPRVMLVEDV
jgi:hypothetical protein